MNIAAPLSARDQKYILRCPGKTKSARQHSQSACAGSDKIRWEDGHSSPVDFAERRPD